MSFHSTLTSTSTVSVRWRSSASLTLVQAAMASGGKSPMKLGLNTAAVVDCATADAGCGASLALVPATLPNSSTTASEATTTNFRPLNILGLLTRSHVNFVSSIRIAGGALGRKRQTA